MPAYNADLAKFAALDAQVVGISPDSTYCHIGWQRFDIGWLKYPLCSDFYPHGQVARLYGIFREGPPLPGISERAVYVVDKQGMVVFAKLYHLGELPPNQEVLAVLERIKTEESAHRAPQAG